VPAAQQHGGFIVMPVIALMLAVIPGIIFLSPFIIVVFVVLYGCLDAGLFYFARAIFNRDATLTK